MRFFFALAVTIVLLTGCMPSTLIYDNGRGLDVYDQKKLSGPLFSDRQLAKKALRNFLKERHDLACAMLDGQYLAHDFMGAEFNVLAVYNPESKANKFGLESATPEFNASLNIQDCVGDEDLAAANALYDFMRHHGGVARRLKFGEMTLHDYAGTTYAIVPVNDKMAGARILIIAAVAKGGGHAYSPDPGSWLVVKGKHKLADYYLPLPESE